MPNLPSLAGARGWLWRVDRIERFSGQFSCALAHLSRHGDGGDVVLIAVRPHEPVARAEASGIPRPAGVGAALDAVIEASRGARQAFSLPAAQTLRGDIHAWQLAPALALARGHARVLVADEAGMGKTTAAALAIAERLREGPDRRCLIIAPGHLIGQWQGELRERMAIACTTIDAPSMRRMQDEIPAGMTPWMLSGCLLTSLDFVKQPHVRRALDRLTWDLLVVDEAHLATGVSERRDAVHETARRARQVLLLTATPSDGGPDRLRALCAIGEGPRSGAAVWLRHVAADRRRVERTLPVVPHGTARQLHDAIAKYARWLQASPAASDAASLLAAVLIKRAHSSAHALRLSLDRRRARLGQDGGAQLSFFDGEDDEGVIGAASGRPIDAERRRLDTLAALAAAAAAQDRRLLALSRLLRRARETAVIFSCFRDTVLLIAGRLSSAGARVRAMHGALPNAAIEAALEDFARGRADVLVTTDVAAQGLNLHHRCRWVIHYDLPWRPTTVRQRVGRVDRIGQARSVHATLLIDRTPLSSTLRDHLETFTARMREDERDGGRRWEVIAACEARRLGALREPGTAAPAARAVAISAFEIDLVDANGECAQRELVILAGDPARAALAAHHASAAARAKLRRPLGMRAARRVAREEDVHEAVVDATAAAPLQRGLFDRRVERAAQLDAAARSSAGADLRDRIQRHVSQARITDDRVRLLASFTFTADAPA